MRVSRRLPVLLAIAVLSATAGCASAKEAQSGSPSGTASSSATRPLVPVAISITHRKVTTASDVVDVKAGSTVRLTVTSDADDELHVHTPDGPEAELHPGVPTTLDVPVDEPGVYEVETHESGLLLVKLAVR